jgi:RimJ/RimL family protein N-acetyltransferase
MKYKCLKYNILIDNEFEIRPILIDDIEKIRLWRNKQMDVLRQSKLITFSEQINYFNNVLIPTFNQNNPKQLIFSYFKNNLLIGYGGLVNISWEDKRSELSFLLNPEFVPMEYIYEQYFLKFIDFMKEINFSILKFHKIFTETYSHRSFHISILEQAGFKLEGTLRDHVIIENKYHNSLIHSIISNV